MCSQLNLQFIERDAFAGCHSLEAVLLSDKIKEIGDDAFEACINLQVLCIPKDSNCLEIGCHAFRGCFKLTSFFYDGIYISQHEEVDDMWAEDDKSDDRYYHPGHWVNLIRDTRSFFVSGHSEYSEYLSLRISSSISARYLYILSHPQNLSILSETLQSGMIPIEFIDEAISYANAHGFYESQMMLMNYRIQHSNPEEDIRKKFEL